MSITKLTSTESVPVEESYCYCNDDISLQMISGGAAPEGYRGRITLKLDDDVYVDYIRKDLYDTLMIRNEELLKANLDCVDHFNAVLEDLKLANIQIEELKK